MVKYHQNPAGRLLVCDAVKQPCPYKTHFSKQAYENITAGRPQNHAQMTAWFNLRVAQDGRQVTDIKKRVGWGYNADFMQALLWAERAGRTHVVELLHDLRARYGNPRVGAFRAVFDRGDGYLIKVPTRPVAEKMNRDEARMSADPNPRIPMADSHEETLSGVPVLITEKVRVLDGPELMSPALPSWVGEVDCRQVGYNRAGELVAYDL